MVHRPSRMVDLLAYAREFRLEAKTMQLVCPKNGEVPNIVLIHFVKNGGKEPLTLKNLDVHKEVWRCTEDLFKNI